MNKKQEKLLNEIHTMATNTDHRVVVYSKNEAKMLEAMIAKLERKLSFIADKVQEICGD